jgi:uncharacterized membrane protein YeaQ/YmgE (transglycosylase-associated protein family)
MTLVLWILIAVVSMLFAIRLAGGLILLFPTLLMGGIAGWLAGKYMRGRGFGIITNVLVGIAGAAIGAILFRLVGLHAVGFIANLVTATVGSIILLSVVRWLNTS